MKALLISSMITAGSLIGIKGHSQVYIHAGVGFRVPPARVYVSPAPVPAPAYEDPAYEDPAYENPAYEDPYYAPAPVTEAYAPPVEYYDYPAYPAWQGHFRDRIYYDHYRPVYERYRAERFRGYRSRENFGHERSEHRGYDHGEGRRRW